MSDGYPGFTRACWWAAGVDGAIIRDADCPVSEQVRFAALGMSVWLAVAGAAVAGFMIAGEVLMPGPGGLLRSLGRTSLALPFAAFFALFVLNLLRLSVGLAGRRTDRLEPLSADALRALVILAITGVLAIAIAAPIQVAVVERDVQAQAMVDDQSRALAMARRADGLRVGGDLAEGAAEGLARSSAGRESTGFFRKTGLAYATNPQFCWAILAAVWLLLALPPVIRLFADRGPYDFLVLHRNRALLAAAGIEPEAFTLHAPDGGAKRVDAFHFARAAHGARLAEVLRQRRQDAEELQQQSLQRPFGVHPTPHRWARKRRVPVAVEFAAERRTIDTLEGPVVADPGDAVVTARTGERWPVARAVFEERYEAVPPVAFGGAGEYLSRPLPVRVVQLSYPISVLVSGGRSRLEGRPGDWLVDYGNGTLGIVAERIFAADYRLQEDAGRA